MTRPVDYTCRYCGGRLGEPYESWGLRYDCADCGRSQEVRPVISDQELREAAEAMWAADAAIDPHLAG